MPPAKQARQVQQARPANTPPARRRREAAIMAAVHAFRRTFAEFHRLLADASQGRISMADLLALQFMAHVGDATPGQVGSFTGLTSGAVTSMLDRLEEAGFVVRERSPKDRRVVVVRLLPGARQRLATMMMAAHERLDAMFEGWSADQVEALVLLLENLGVGPPASRTDARRH